MKASMPSFSGISQATFGGYQMASNQVGMVTIVRSQHIENRVWEAYPLKV